MLLTANAGGWTAVVSMAGYVEPRALRFYKKAIDGTLRTVTPHTEEFKSTVTTDGMSRFEGIVEGELLSPCELEPEKGIEFLANNMDSLEQLNASNMVKNWKEECRARLHGDGSEKNLWVGLLLGIIKDSQTYLCHEEDCSNGSQNKKLNLNDATWKRSTFDIAFRNPGELKRKYKLRNTFFKNLFYEVKGGRNQKFKKREGRTGDSEVKIFKNGMMDNGQNKLVERKVCDQQNNFAKTWEKFIRGTNWGDKLTCEKWVERINSANKVYVIDARTDEKGGNSYDGIWWKATNGNGTEQNNPLKFWWWWGADPEGQNRAKSEAGRKKDHDEIKRYWTAALGASEVCVPVPAMTRKESFQTNYDMTIESIRCEQKNP